MRRTIRKRKDRNKHFKFNVKEECIAQYNRLELRSVFQPIFSLDEKTLGFEALIRARDHNGDPICSNDLFRTLEREDPEFYSQRSIDKLAWTLHLKNFIHFPKNNYIFLNILPSSLQLFYKNQNTLMRHLLALGISPSMLVLEILEHEYLDNDILCDLVIFLKEYGFQIAVDDYGMKYSNEERVRKIKPDIIKIDHSLLIRYMSTEKQPLLDAISLAKDVSSKVLVEGIENRAQYDAMRLLKVDYFQGFYLGIPMTIEDACRRKASKVPKHKCTI